MQKKSLILHPHGNILSRKSLQNHIITAGEFGLMEKPPRLHARYDKYEPEKYHCVEIDDDDIEPLMMEFQKIPCFYHTRQKPGMGLAWCGITLIPPEAAEAFLSCRFYFCRRFSQTRKK